MKEGIFILEDGAHWSGKAVGVQKDAFGETVFYTGVIGYQEVITDPAYFGNIVVMTYPHIGNYGINDDGFATPRLCVRGIVVKETSRMYSNWKATGDLLHFARKNGLFILSGVDTQNITSHLRIHGSMKGVLTCRTAGKKEILEKLKSRRLPENRVVQISCKKAYQCPGNEDGPYKVAAIDLGIDRFFLKMLTDLGCRVMVFPYTVPAEEILGGQYRAVFISDGPGDQVILKETVTQVKELIGRRPILGIGLGFQILCLALGGKSVRMKVGHYGLNQPVRCEDSNTCLSTTQAHLYTVTPESLTFQMQVTHRHLNDGTLEGFSHKNLPVFGLQYRPAPGDPVLKKFIGAVHA